MGKLMPHYVRLPATVAGLHLVVFACLMPLQLILFSLSLEQALNL